MDLGLHVIRLSEGLDDGLIKVVVLNELVEYLEKGSIGVGVERQ